MNRTTNYLFTLLSLFLLMGCNAETQEGEVRIAAGGASTGLNDLGISKCATPQGWIAAKSNGNTAVAFARNTGTPGEDELISIDVIDAPFASAEQTASAFARKFSGTVSPEKTMLDGEPAFRVSIPPNYSELLPRECVVSHHNNKACLIIGGTKSKNDIWGPISEISRSWKWN